MHGTVLWSKSTVCTSMSSCMQLGSDSCMRIDVHACTRTCVSAAAGCTGGGGERHDTPAHGTEQVQGRPERGPEPPREGTAAAGPCHRASAATSLRHHARGHDRPTGLARGDHPVRAVRRKPPDGAHRCRRRGGSVLRAVRPDAASRKQPRAVDAGGR